jgi:TolB-like protein
LSLYNELKHRNVFRVALGYIVSCWLLAQVADLVLENIGAPDWVMQTILLVLTLGFPVVVFFSWAYEVTPEGIKRESEIDRSQSITHVTSRKLDRAIIAVLIIALGYFAWESRFSRPKIGAEQALPAADAIPQQAAPQATAEPAPVTSKKSIAVLPFDNRSRNADDEYFTEGIHDDLLTNLARIGSLKVISRTSVNRYKKTDRSIPEIAAELGVATIMEGAVQRSGSMVHINVQLIDAKTDEHLWAEIYDRELTAENLFAIQGEIASSIASALQATLARDDEQRLNTIPTDNLEALEAYFTGKQLADERGREAIESAIGEFERAISLDPEFALAHAGLGYAWLLMPEYSATVDPKLSRDSSKAAIARALELDPELPSGLAFMGWSKMAHEYDWIAAEQLLRRALELQANNSGALHWLSHVLSWQGHHAEAIAVARQAVEVDPYSPLMTMNLAYILMDDGRFAETAKYRERTLELRPDYTELWRNTWLTLMRAGEFDNATEALVNWAAGTGRDVDKARQLGRILEQSQSTGNMAQFPQDLLANLGIGNENLGQVYAAGGDADSAIAEIKIALDERAGSRSVLSMKINPLYDFFRDDPRFIEMLKETNL